MAANLSDDMTALVERVAKVLQPALPSRFRGIFRIVVDNGVIKPHDITVEFRKPQPKAGDMP